MPLAEIRVSKKTIEIVWLTVSKFRTINVTLLRLIYHDTNYQINQCETGINC